MESNSQHQISQVQAKYLKQPISNLGKSQLGLQGEFTCNLQACLKKHKIYKSYTSFYNHLKKDHKTKQVPNPVIFNGIPLHFNSTSKGRPHVNIQNITPEQIQRKKALKEHHNIISQFIYTTLHEYYLDRTPNRKDVFKIVEQKAIRQQALNKQQMIQQLQNQKDNIIKQVLLKMDDSETKKFTIEFVQFMKKLINKLNHFPDFYDPMTMSKINQKNGMEYVDSSDIEDLLKFEQKNNILDSSDEWNELKLKYSEKFMNKLKFDVILSVMLLGTLVKQIYVEHFYMIINVIFLQSCLKMSKSVNQCEYQGEILLAKEFQQRVLQILNQDNPIYKKTTQISRRKFLSQRHKYLKFRGFY